MPEPKEHAARRNWVETILRYIPGFRGYLEKEYRRESDQLVRQWLAGRLAQAKRALDELSRGLAEAGHLHLLTQLDRLRHRIDKLSGRISGAMAGYSGFFDYVRITERILDRIYEHDLGLMAAVDNVGSSIASWTPDRLSQETITSLLSRLEELELAWDKRSHILEGID